MLRYSFLLFLVGTGCLLSAADSQTVQAGSFTSSNNGSVVKVQYSTVAEPASRNVGRGGNFSGGSSYDAKSIHRWVIDKGARSYFGYDLMVEQVSGATQCRVSILPLSLSADEIRRTERGPEIDSSWKALQLPAYPDPQVVQPPDTITLDLFVSPDGKQKVTEYLQTTCGMEKAVATETGPVRDFTIEDVELNVSTGSLYVNGNPAGGTPVVGDATGAIVWFYFPGKGRFLTSIAPHNGYNFQKAGTVKRNVISFEFGGDRYEVRTTHPIASSRGTWNAYVMFDSAYQPSGSNAAFGGAESVDTALAQR